MAMMTMNADDKATMGGTTVVEALGVSAQHFHIASCSGNDDNNNGDDDDECQRQGLGCERPAFLYHVAQRQ